MKSKTFKKLTDEELDSLSPEEIQSIKVDIWADNEAFLLRSSRAPIVAEGDSWFDYQPAGFDILDFLKRQHGHNLKRLSDAGDTLENMAFGTELKRNLDRKSPPIEETKRYIRKYQPDVFLLSAGGNDIAGGELLAMLNHAETGLPPLRASYLDTVINNLFRPGFDHIAQSIWAEKPDVKIITHGYGYAPADGRAVINALGFKFIGPWLKPAFMSKGIESRQVADKVVQQLIDRLNDLHHEFATKYPGKYHHIDLRSLIKKKDWENELHLKNSAFRRVAAEFDRVISSI